MAMLPITQAADASRGDTRRTLIARLAQFVRRRRAYSAVLRELRMLSDRDLDDLGISRWMITRVAAEAARSRTD